METTGLMIGDWVLCDGKPYRIAEIGGMVCIDADKELFATLDDIQPIPLTPEILEKNGFHISKKNALVNEFFFAADLEWIPHTCIEVNLYKHPIMGAETLIRIWTKSQGCEGQNNVHICNLRFIHELQHALRLCGIEKEIVL
jgi:hypothetical protein